jgi:carbon storage regulator
MLVLTRRPGQAIRVGPNVEVRVVRIEGDRVVLGIAAPRHVAVVRSELIEEVSGEVREAADTRARLRIMLAPLHDASPSELRPEPPEPQAPDIA